MSACDLSTGVLSTSQNVFDGMLSGVSPFVVEIDVFVLWKKGGVPLLLSSVFDEC